MVVSKHLIDRAQFGHLYPPQKIGESVKINNPWNHQIANIISQTPGDKTPQVPTRSPETCIEPCDTVFRGHLVNDHHAFDDPWNSSLKQLVPWHVLPYAVYNP